MPQLQLLLFLTKSRNASNVKHATFIHQFRLARKIDTRDRATFEILMSLVREIVDVLVFYRKGTGATYNLASKIGEEYHFPTFALADSLNTGRYEPLPNNAGSYVKVDKEIGPDTYALRTLSFHKPIYLEVGHNLEASQIIPLTFEFSKIFRTPEIVRNARVLARQTLRENLADRL